jgi:hypothetical protein
VGVDRCHPLGEVEAVADPLLVAEVTSRWVMRSKAPSPYLASMERRRSPGSVVRGVELEGPPPDLHTVETTDPGSTAAIEPALAEKAPRTDDVGPDVDAHVGCNVRGLRELPATA